MLCGTALKYEINNRKGLRYAVFLSENISFRLNLADGFPAQLPLPAIHLR